MATKAKEEQALAIELPGIDTGAFSIDIVGDTPLIVHAWAEKAKKEMLEKQMKKASKGKEAKNPMRDFLDAIYFLDEYGNQTASPKELDGATMDTPPEEIYEALSKAKYGFPSVAFKACALDAGYQQGVIPKKTTARGAFHILGEFVEIRDSVPDMREDMVQIGGISKVADIRYRPEFKGWRTTLTIRYNKRAITPEQIVNLLNYGGFSNGVGEWRASRDGSFGMFHCETVRL